MTATMRAWGMTARARAGAAYADMYDGVVSSRVAVPAARAALFASVRFA